MWSALVEAFGTIRAILDYARPIGGFNRLLVVLIAALALMAVLDAFPGHLGVPPEAQHLVVLGIIGGMLLCGVAGMVVYVHDVRGARGPPDLRPRLGAPLTVGILSFAEIGVREEEEARGAGFAKEIGARLARLDGLDVVPERDMLSFEKSTDTRQIAYTLLANYIIEGTLRESGGTYRVDVHVIPGWDAESWGGQWERPRDELFALQSEVAEGVARHLLASMRVDRPEDRVLDDDERKMLGEAPSESQAAHEIYNRGAWAVREFNNTRGPEDFVAAEEALLEALNLDPEYRDAQAELGFLYLLQWETHGSGAWLARSKETFHRLADEVPGHPVATAELGYLTLVDGQHEKALEMVRRSAKDNPRSTIPQNVLALTYMYIGCWEAAIYRTDTVVTRLDRKYVYPYANAAQCCSLLGDCDGALRWAERAEDKDPSAFVVSLVEGAAWFCKDERGLADRAWRRGLRVAPSVIDPIFEVVRAWVPAAEGNSEAARRAIDAHRDDRWLGGAYDPYFISLCALAGEDDLALNLLESQRTWAASYRYLVSDPTLRGLWHHPRFEALLVKRYERWRALLDIVDTAPVTLPTVVAPDEFLDRVGRGKEEAA